MKESTLDAIFNWFLIASIVFLLAVTVMGLISIGLHGKDMIAYQLYKTEWNCTRYGFVSNELPRTEVCAQYTMKQPINKE